MGFPIFPKLRRFLPAILIILAGQAELHAQGFGLFNKKQCDCNPYVCPLPTPGLPPTTDPGKLPDSKVPDKKAPEDLVPAPSLDTSTTAALGGSGVSVGATAGYIDNALPFTHMRIRYDAAWDGNFPDRAEFLYGKCGCFRVAGVDPNAPGPPNAEKRIDYQNGSAYFEMAKEGIFSVFVEGVYKQVNLQQNSNATDFGDMNAGFKVALLAYPEKLLTFQLRTYIPTGNAVQGLGTNHVSLEPSLLFAANPNSKLNIFGQVGCWLPINGTDFAGNVMIYGVGASYIVYDTCNFRIAPVAEVLGWTVLGGQKSNFYTPTALSAYGDTIVNIKFGLRFGFGPGPQNGVLGNSDLYVGYGHAVTKEVWYNDILRVEYRIRF